MANNANKYRHLTHAMQTGVEMVMEFDSKETSPKHLRVGVNSAHVSDAALANILIRKGIITLEEYEAELAAEMAKEVARYTARLQQKFGSQIDIILG